MMTKRELDEQLVEACEEGYPDINKIQELILGGHETADGAWCRSQSSDQ